ncbi:MAG: ABC transporter permease [Sphingobacteriales bacterium]|nr:MAG: ABC transporter permease [Sphingobacteriales bacterium]
MSVSPELLDNNERWTEVIEPEKSIFNVNLKEVWDYRDLLVLLVRRDFVATYKQTILGPIWFFIQPVLTTITFAIVFGRIAGVSTDGIPMFLFYMAGITLWNYFSECLNRTATVFKDNSAIFGKVYFPRLVMPLSIVASNLVKLAIQLLLFIAVWVFYLVTTTTVHPNAVILLFPVLILMIGLLGLGTGMIVSSLTSKYRDLIFLLVFGTQLLMYATPVIYPLSTIGEKYRWLIMANPMTAIIETFKYGFLGKGYFSIPLLLYSFAFTTISVVAGVLIFNKVERNFIDTV